MMRLSAATLLTLCVSSSAYAQAPGDPYAPVPAPAPAPSPAPSPAPAPAPTAAPLPEDPVLNEQIAQSLVDRAQELFDAAFYLDAKQLAVEAIVKSPKGPSADRARYIVRIINEHLNIKDDPPPTPPSQAPVAPDIPQVGDRVNPVDPSTAEEPPPPPMPAGSGSPGTAAAIHGALYGGTIGTMIGVASSSDHPAAAAIPIGIVGGLGVGYLSVKLATRARWDEAQVRTAGSYANWGGVIGGLFGDAVTGAGTGPNDHPTATGIMVGASIGATLGGGIGIAMARTHKFTRGDVALNDTLSGIGAIGGLTMGMFMQPAQPEAYAINSMLGVAAGQLIGFVAGPQTNTTPRRMARVAGLSAAGGAVPFLLYAGIHDKSTHGDERITGILSSAGLVVGAYVGFRLTSNMDVGLDVQPGAKSEGPVDDAPIALLGRSSAGHWSMSGVGIQPLSHELATTNPGATLTLVGAAF